jgi:hypothetical protein
LHNFKLTAKKLLENYNVNIAIGKTHKKETKGSNDDMSNKKNNITVVDPKGPVIVQISEHDSIVKFESISDELIEKLNQLLLCAEEKDKGNINNAIMAAKNKDEKGFHSAIKKVGKVTLSTCEGVLGNVIYAYLHQQGLF